MLVGGLLVAAIAFGLTWFGAVVLKDPATHLPAFWVATPVGVVLLVRAYRVPRAVLLGGFTVGVVAADLAHGSSVGAAVSFGVAASVEALVAAVATLRLTGIDARLDEPNGALLRGWREARGFALAGLLGVVAAAVSMSALRTVLDTAPGLLTLRTYVLGHLTGLLVLAAPLLCMPRNRVGWARWLRDGRANLEWLGFLVATLAVSVPQFDSGGAHVMPFLVLAPVLVAAERLEPLRATVVLWAACAAATLGTLHGRGPLAQSSDHGQRLLLLQGYLVALCVATLVVCLLAGVRRNAGALARESAQLLDLAFDRAPTGMYIIGLDPAQPGRLLHVNAALCTLVQRPAAELIGRHVGILLPDEDAPVLAEMLERMVGGELDQFQLDRMLVRSDGRRLPTRVAANVVRPERGSPYLVVQLTDLRDRIEAERAMTEALTVEAKALGELRRINEARVATAARLAHDLRSPLTVARAYQELVCTGAAGELTAEQVEMLEIALTNTDKVIGLVDDLVSTASVQLDRIDTSHRRTVAVRTVLDAALETVQPMITERGQTLDRPHRDLDEEFLVDPTQLERALVNVLHNASRYTREGGSISVTVDADATGIAIAVSDTGIGIDPAQLDRLGEQFFRADTAKQHGVRGVGLGLAVAKAVLAKHGGRLHVSSVPDAGSTFTLWVPRDPVETPTPGRADEPGRAAQLVA
ncbi:MAG: ATP-binding protein [Jatrophihabitans sp.]|uniref:ATP-binding protein n=1 Tax=Jatrophihabitans sp. TaxID=1932789 RepID=UPI003F81CD4D